MKKINFKKALALALLIGSFSCEKSSKDLEKKKVVKPEKVLAQKIEEPKAKNSKKTEKLKVKALDEIKRPSKEEVNKVLEKHKKSSLPQMLTLAEVLKLKSQADSYKALSIKFKEELYRDLRKKTRKKEGEAYFIRPNKFLWKVGDLNSKTKQLWIYNGSTLLQHNTEDKHAIRYGANLSKSKELNRLVGYLVNFKELFASHHLLEAVEKEGNISLKLATKAKTNIKLILISLAVKKENKEKIVTLKSLQIFYHDKNKTSFDFGIFKEEKVDEAKLKLSSEIKISDALK